MRAAVLGLLAAAQFVPVDPTYRKSSQPEQEGNRISAGWNALYCFAVAQRDGWYKAFSAWTEHEIGAQRPARFPQGDQWDVLAQQANDALVKEFSRTPNCSRDDLQRFAACEPELCGAPACGDELGHLMVQALAVDWNASQTPIAFPCPPSPAQELAAQMREEGADQDYKRARWAELCLPAELKSRVTKVKRAKAADSERWKAAIARSEQVAAFARADLDARNVKEQIQCADVVLNAGHVFSCAYPDGWCNGEPAVGKYRVRQRGDEAP